MSSEWCTIESDPGVFTELIEKFGVKDVQVEELYDLEASTFVHLQPVYGLIFLFKWQKEEASRATEQEQNVPGLFFARQVITNACATQAILAILLNRPELELGPELSQLKEFTAEFPAEMKGLSLANSAVIRNAHNSFARQESFTLDESRLKSEDSEAFHFISYVPFNGKLYELDGLQPGPICLDENVTLDNWIEKARPAIQQRIQQYASSEIRFNLMALVKNRLKSMEERLGLLKSRIEIAESRIAGTAMETSSDESLPSDPDQLQITIAAMQNEIDQWNLDMQSEKDKRKRWTVENQRRQHNYIPFIFALLKKLAETQKLEPLVEQAKEKQKRISEQNQKRKKK